MSVEYIPFDPTLIGKEEIIIWCPEERHYGSLMRTLEEHGVKWYSGNRPTTLFLWCDGSSDAFYIDLHKDMLRSGIVDFEEGYRSYCKFMRWPAEQEVAPDVGDLI